jgi:hypothetical protein
VCVTFDVSSYFLMSCPPRRVCSPSLDTEQSLSYFFLATPLGASLPPYVALSVPLFLLFFLILLLTMLLIILRLSLIPDVKSRGPITHHASINILTGTTILSHLVTAVKVNHVVSFHPGPSDSIPPSILTSPLTSYLLVSGGI